MDQYSSGVWLLPIKFFKYLLLLQAEKQTTIPETILLSILYEWKQQQQQLAFTYKIK